MDCAICECLPSMVKIEQLKEESADFAATNGILMKAKAVSLKTNKCHQFSVPAPFTLFPSPVSKVSLDFLMGLQQHVNKLMHLVSQDEEYMTETLQEVVEADDFTRRLFEIYKTVKSSNGMVAPELGFFRSDYMFDFDQKSGVSSPKQIEINTMAASFVGIGTQRMKQLHEHTLRCSGMTNQLSRLPDNFATKNMAKGFFSAWKLYGNPKAVILFLVLGEEFNIYDQRVLEYEILAEDPSIRTRRKGINEMAEDMKVESDGRLFVDNEEVAVAYFRSGYSPQDYTSEKTWDMRLRIEQSRAIKCPSVAHQLVGTKKMQEILARPGQVERFVDKDVAGKIRKTFAGLYTLDMSEAGDAAVKEALKNPEDYVLKPQREGGGNNVYNEDLVKLLEEIGGDKRRSAYILMDKIRPKSTRNYIISSFTATMAETVCELGIYGVFLATGKELVENKTAGHLLRSKSNKHNDGGVNAGVAVLDSPLLVDI